MAQFLDLLLIVQISFNARCWREWLWLLVQLPSSPSIRLACPILVVAGQCPLCPEGNCNNTNRLIWPRYICSHLAAPQGQDGESCLLFWLRYGNAHSALSWRVAHFMGAHTCRHSRDKLRTTETLKGKCYTYEQDPTAVGSGHCNFSWQEFKLKSFRLIFIFFTFLVFTKLLWNLPSKSYLFLKAVYKQVCYSFSLYAAFHFSVFFLLFFSTIIF